MNYFWVNHKQTHQEELEGGYIWSPKENSDGSRNQTYINLTKTSVGDLVFSYAYTKIQAIGVVDKQYQEKQRPEAFGKTGEHWDEDGWMVNVDWLLLDEPFKPKDQIDKIAPLLPKKYSPIRKNGDGNQGCYLAEISDEFGSLLIDSIQSSNPNILDMIDERKTLIKEDEEERQIKGRDIPETEKEQLVKSRRGQGVFRNRLEEIEDGCRITGVTDKRFLIASHIKPWKDSTDEEKLDGNNGLLLSPHLDKLFDQGWITFSNSGRLKIAHKDVEKTLKSWGIDLSLSIGDLNNQQIKYLNFHRENIFKTSQVINKSLFD